MAIPAHLESSPPSESRRGPPRRRIRLPSHAKDADIDANVMIHNISATGLLVERSEEHTSELQSLMRISYAVFCLKKKKKRQDKKPPNNHTLQISNTQTETRTRHTPNTRQ